MSPEERRAWCADLKRGDKVFVHGPGYNPSPDDPDTVVATLDDEVIVAIGGEPGIILRFDRFGIETGTASTWIVPAVREPVREPPDLDRLVRVVELSLAFSRVQRATYHEDGLRRETDADHTVMLGLVALEVNAMLQLGFNPGQLVLYALVHDLPEVDTGDVQTLVITPEARAEKQHREAQAIQRLGREFPGPITLTLHQYEAQNTPETRFIRVLDKILPKLTHLLNGCRAAKELTDRAGFVRAHEQQYAALRAEYPDVDYRVFDLLGAAMRTAQEAW